MDINDFDDDYEEGEEGITIHPMEVLYTGLDEGLSDSSSDDDNINSDEEEFKSLDNAVDGLLDVGERERERGRGKGYLE